MLTFYPVFSHSLWIRAPDVPSLICESVLAHRTPVPLGREPLRQDQGQQEVRVQGLWDEVKDILTPVLSPWETWTPGRRSWCGPWKGGLATYVGRSRSALVISMWTIGSVFGPTEFCHPLPPELPTSECKLWGGSGGQRPSKCWELSFYP